MPNLLYQDMLDEEGATTVPPTIIGARTTLSELENWVPRMQGCRFVLHLSASFLSLLKRKTTLYPQRMKLNFERRLKQLRILLQIYKSSEVCCFSLLLFKRVEESQG